MGTPTVAPSSQPTPSDPTGPSASVAQWIKFHTTKGSPTENVAWSPDARFVLVQGGNPNAGYWDLGTDLVDETGKSIHWYPLVGGGSWLDNEHFIVFSSDETRPGYDWPPDHAWLGDTSGNDLQQLDLPHGTSASANGHGAIAISRYLGMRNGIERDEYWIWSNGVASEARSGFPYNWSLDGSKLAVVHPFEPTRGTLGWREIVSWPGLETVWKEDPPNGGASVDFDPTGQFMALPGDETLADGSTRYFTRIIDFDTAQSVEVPATDRSSYFWANGQLNTIADGVLRSYDTSGDLVGERPAPADGADPSPDGTAVFYPQGSGDATTSFVIERGADTMTLDLAAPAYYGPVLSNDGRGVAVNNNDAIYLSWLTP